MQELLPAVYRAGVNRVVKQHLVDEFAPTGGFGAEQDALERRFLDEFSQGLVGLRGGRLQRQLRQCLRIAIDVGSVRLVELEGRKQQAGKFLDSCRQRFDIEKQGAGLQQRPLEIVAP